LVQVGGELMNPNWQVAATYTVAIKQAADAGGGDAVREQHGAVAVFALRGSAGAGHVDQ
jgi:hypothetical protein